MPKLLEFSGDAEFLREFADICEARGLEVQRTKRPVLSASAPADGAVVVWIFAGASIIGKLLVDFVKVKSGSCKLSVETKDGTKIAAQGSSVREVTRLIQKGETVLTKVASKPRKRLPKV